ncbi:prepilin-type N-terminal cleavage/methylation domain-containing protein [bacterium]|nr:prepilin-type N-terminal cleavage/methylation domain-containing protein [bacterium]
MNKAKYKLGFTLAEVLITLVIIGIIAATTIPTIQANYAQQERYTRVKKAYSTLANAMTRVKADGGDFDFEVRNNDTELIKDWYDTYLKQYLNTIKVCYNEAGCWNEGDTKNLNGGNAYCQHTGIGVGDNIVTAILSDGTFINIDSYSKGSIASYFGVDITQSNGLVVIFDINGNRKPNTFGRDIFATVFTENGLVPAYSSRTAAQINSNCSPSGNGYSCIQKYLQNK